MCVSVSTGCVSRNVASVLRAWAVVECVPGARGRPRGRWQDMCVCVCVRVSRVCACVGGHTDVQAIADYKLFEGRGSSLSNSSKLLNL